MDLAVTSSPSPISIVITIMVTVLLTGGGYFFKTLTKALGDVATSVEKLEEKVDNKISLVSQKIDASITNQNEMKTDIAVIKVKQERDRPAT